MTKLASMTDEQFEAWLRRNRITGLAAAKAGQNRRRAVAVQRVREAMEARRAEGISDAEAMAAGGPFPIVEG